MQLRLHTEKSLHWICQDDVRACKVYDEIKEVSIKNEEDWPVMSAFHIQRAKKHCSLRQSSFWHNSYMHQVLIISNYRKFGG